MLTVWQGNRLETLADRLADVVRRPLATALTPDVVVVQNTGMARWVSLHLARTLGVCANVRFRLPAAFLWETYRAIAPEGAAVDAVEPDVATWHLMALLGGVGDDPRFAPVRAYLGDHLGDPLGERLGDGADGRKRYELARRLADTFEQYQVYRPAWIAEWERGGGDGWQPELWRRLVARGVKHHRAALQGELLRELGRAPVDRLPPRVSLFGIPALAPAYLEVFQQLGERIELGLYLLSPCSLFWGDTVSPRDASRAGQLELFASAEPEGENDLLASMGKQGRDFLHDVAALGGFHQDAFEEPAGNDMLGAVQRDVLARRNPSDRTVPVAAADRSIQLHACHSPMREVEVLHDQLLAMFDADPSLRPSDVVVMMPDIERYAPCVEAVFGAVGREQHVPFTIADRSRRAESRLVEAFFALLDLPGSRWDAARLLALLESPSVRRRFGIAAADLPLVRRWVQDAGIRWGIDAAGRAAADLPATTEHTWRFGLDRLLLGYALAGDAPVLFEGVLPCADVEGSQTAVLGQLHAFAEAAFALDGLLAASRPLAEWADVLAAALARFVEAEDDEEADAQAIRDALVAMAESAGAAGFAEPVASAVVQTHLHRLLDVDAPRGRFLAGRVTFCAMVPMRSIPFEVVCLLGMDVASFPRTRRPPGFDLMAEKPRRGDRSRRDDDRYLFLEAIVSARRCLYLSWVGRSIRDNTDVPPSVLVSELLDYLRRGFTAPDGRDLVDHHLRVDHPLQPFSRRYFAQEAPLFSYSASLCDASRALRRGEGRTSMPICGEPLDAAEERWREVTPEALVRFFRNPTRFFLEQRLGIRLDEAPGVVETREPFALDALARFGLRDDMLRLRLDGGDGDDPLDVMRARGALPHGELGRAAFRSERGTVEGFVQRVAAAIDGDRLPPLPVELRLGAMTVRGTLAGLTRGGLVDYRLARTKARDRLGLWIRHLILACAAPPGVALRSLWLGDDATVTLGPVAEPAATLRTLVDLYWDGLRRPLHFFPETALTCLAKGGDLGAARDVWEGDEYGYRTGEGSDAYYQAAFRDTDPLDAELVQLAGQVFGPYVLAAAEEKLERR